MLCRFVLVFKKSVTADPCSREGTNKDCSSDPVLLKTTRAYISSSKKINHMDVARIFPRGAKNFIPD